ncbi:excinuclease ABC subunit A [Alloprevotella sp. OH1205_COT-284]|uniref:excinuclease ABC subunit UvrA n=1 Tax=Alloprevotella sp. OH1205_COT-284 TaxID=2491043 RepID=UPI000F5F6257|nr:excinuclease ABC subunit UvrA [Alloprevotella sp. OH1205_COT-284]RRD80751.1 excinuclease ABC subunit A [Alloprevotella sp. OH1205_COT-284]
MNNAIIVKGARVNNLKNIDLEIPREKFVVITGLSGSGKSSLAFDTLYAEGQRRYVESLSAYARQFLGRMNKPECDFIKGLPPAIAIEQKVTSRNPRSTVGTSTEIYEYLRLLFARIGRTYSPVSGEEVRRHSADDVVEAVLKRPVGTRFTVLAPLKTLHDRTFKEQIEVMMQQGLSRLDVDGKMLRMEEAVESEAALFENERALAEKRLFLLIDRLVVDGSKDGISRLTDSVETALFEGDGECLLRFYPEGELVSFSTRFEADGIVFETPGDNLFSFNSPAGACPKCEGFGRVVGIDESLVVPDRSLSVYDGAVMCWRGEKMSIWQQEFMRKAAQHDFPIFEPYFNLTDAQRELLWHGGKGIVWDEGGGDVSIDNFFRMLEENQYKIQYRVMLSRYRGKTSCPFCKGSRLRKEALYVRVGGRTIADLVRMPVSELSEWFDALQLDEHETQVASRLLVEIRNRLRFLDEVGLSYLTLDRLSNSLSGGESQRINLATSLGSSLVGSLYILDEPSIGLHSRDTDRLIRVLQQLRDQGNTVVVVEHDEDIIRAADHIIDIGPEAGRNGGEVVWNGTAMSVLKSSKTTSVQSHTVNFLNGAESIPTPSVRRRWNRSIDIIGARHNNLKGIDVKFPLNVFTVVTGVSGSGKSTLVRDIFYQALRRELNEGGERPGEFVRIEGNIADIKIVDFVDQNPIGKSSRSNPVTYVKAYDEIRKLMAEQPLARQLDMTPAFFSFNTDGGRCEECKGEGTVKVEMQFMADLVLECESCHGRRFKSEVLDVKFAGKNICDILDMTVNQAIEFFDANKKKKIVCRLRPLQDVGLGYIKLGQSSSTLSGGENQRVKLAYYLGQERCEPTLFIFDEPTTGLHFHDIQRLLKAFDALIDRGHSIVVIEHNLDVIKTADHLIDLGPEGGAEGGRLVFAGTPEELVKHGKGYTARYLSEKMA